MSRSVEARKRKFMTKLGVRFYRGYPYWRVTPGRLRLNRPDWAFLCHVATPRALVREVNHDIKRSPLKETLPLFREAA